MISTLQGWTKSNYMFHKLIGLFLCMLIFLTQFAVAENINFIYDNNGNLLEGVNQEYEYNDLNQLIKVSDKSGKVLEEYTYDSDDNRIKKIEYLSNGKTETTYYPSKNLMRVINSSGTYDTFYVYDEQGTLLSRKDPDGKMFYYHPDHLGSTTLVTNEAGQIVEETSYMPFGEVWEGGSDEYLFTGKEKDATGLMYYGARYYDSFLKRFTQPDTVIQEIYNPQNLNRYSYVLNNPYKYTDPDGHNPILLGLLIGALISAGMDMISQILSDDASMFDGSMDWGSVGESATMIIPIIEQFGETINQPSGVNVFFAGLSVYDIFTPGIPEGKIVKSTANAFIGQSKTLKNGGTVVVSSFKEADQLLHQIYPDAKKIPGAGPKTYEKFKFDQGLEKKFNHEGFATYNKDYLYDPETKKIYNHNKGENLEHQQNSHININNVDGTKATIIIKKK